MAKSNAEIRQIIRYVIIGGLTTVISIASYWLFYTPLKMPNVVATILSWVLAVVFAFWGNKFVVFQSGSLSAKVLLREGIEFLGARVATGVMEVLSMWLTVDILALPGTAMKLIISIIIVVLNYILSKLFIFKN